MHLWILLKKTKTSSSSSQKANSSFDGDEYNLQQLNSDANLVVALGLVAIALFMTQLTFLVLRLDGNISWLWCLIFIPTWLLLGLLTLLWLRHVHIASLSHTESSLAINPTDMSSTRIFRARTASIVHHNWQLVFNIGIQLLCIITFFVLLTLRLDLSSLSDLPWSVVFVPLYVLWLSTFISSLWYSSFSSLTTTAAFDSVSARAVTTAQWLYRIAIILTYVSVGVLLLLISVQLDADTNWSWIAVLVPAGVVWLLVQALWLVAHVCVKIGARQYVATPYGRSWFFVTIEIITLITLSIFLGLITAYLEQYSSGGGDDTMTAVTLLCPFCIYGFIVAVLFWFQNFLDDEVGSNYDTL